MVTYLRTVLDLPDEVLDAILMNISTGAGLKHLSLVCNRFNRLVHRRLWNFVHIDLDRLAEVSIFSANSGVEEREDNHDGGVRTSNRPCHQSIIPDQATEAATLSMTINRARKLADSFDIPSFPSCFPRARQVCFDFANLNFRVPAGMNVESVTMRFTRKIPMALAMGIEQSWRCLTSVICSSPHPRTHLGG